PVPVQLPLKHTALVCIDFQRDFLDQGGFGAALGNDVNLARTCLPAAATLLEAARESGLVIVHTKEGHAQDLSDCPPTKRNGLRAPPHGLRIGDEAGLGKLLVEGSAANDFVPEAAPLEGEIVLRKPGKGAFFCTDLHERLRALKVTHLVVCGVTTEVCVQTTIREANDRGYECVLVEDATASYFPHFKRATIEMMRSQGGIAGYTLAKADDFAAALRGDDAVEPPPQTPPTAPPKAVVAAPARLERAVRRHGASVAAACLATGLAAALARRRPSAHAISLIGAAFAAGALSARYFASMAAEREVRAMAALAVREALPGADKGDVNIQCDYDRLFGMCQHDTAVARIRRRG
ncbi:Isochorismatase-like protein, partial [Pelagophyceae sp. CCMP2097]